MPADNLNEWIIIYRGYTAAQLAADQAMIIRWLANPYDSQGQGAKSYARNLQEMRTRLAALQRVYNEGNRGADVQLTDASAGLNSWPTMGEEYIIYGREI